MSGFVGWLTGRVHVRFCWLVDMASKCQVLLDG